MSLVFSRFRATSLAGSFFIAHISQLFADTAILYALPSELAALKQELRMVGEPVKIADRSVYIGYRKGEKVVLAQSGSGQIPAAITTQAVLQRFKPDRLISIGPAGNLRDDWKAGDILVATEIVHYEAGSEKSAGFILKEPVKVKPEYAEMCEKLRNAAKEEILRQAQDDKPGVVNDKFVARFGRIASGDKFIATSAKRIWLRETFQADAVDMMSAAIARACEANGVPYLMIRVLSDNADEFASQDFANFLKAYNEPLTAAIAIKLLDAIVAASHSQ